MLNVVLNVVLMILEVLVTSSALDVEVVDDVEKLEDATEIVDSTELEDSVKLDDIPVVMNRLALKLALKCCRDSGGLSILRCTRGK